MQIRTAYQQMVKYEVLRYPNLFFSTVLNPSHINYGKLTLNDSFNKHFGLQMHSAGLNIPETSEVFVIFIYGPDTILFIYIQIYGSTA